MKVIQKSGHQEMCGGYSYDYTINCDSRNLEDVLKEIKEYTNKDEDNFNFTKIDDFGKDGGTENWGIYIDKKIYKSSWSEPFWKELYTDKLSGKIVTSISGSGGWYCAVNFYINLE